MKSIRMLTEQDEVEGRAKGRGHRQKVELLPDGEARFLRLKTMVDTRSAACFKLDSGPQLLDVFTASMLVKIAENLNEKNRAKFLGMPLFEMVTLGWLLLERNKA